MTRSSQPNFTTLNPDGSIGATFPGGIVMRPDNDPFPDPPNAIEWVEESSGVLVAYSWASSSSEYARYDSVPQKPGGVSRASYGVVENDAAPNLTAGVMAVGLDAGEQQVFLQAGSIVRELLDSNGASDFPGLDSSNAKVRVRWGVVNGLDGSTITGGGGYSTSRTGAGVYRIDWNPPFVDFGGVANAGVGALPLITSAAHIVGSIGTGDFSVIRTFNAANAATDISFAFVAVGELA